LSDQVASLEKNGLALETRNRSLVSSYLLVNKNIQEYLEETLLANNSVWSGTLKLSFRNENI
jgi:hypothetical protein